MKYLLFFLVVTAISCNNSNKRMGMYLEQYKGIIGQELLFDNSANEINIGKSSFNSDYTIICTGNTDCSTCAITLFECDSYLKRCNLVNKINVKFIVSGIETEYYFHQVNNNDFTFSVIYDNNFITNNGLEAYSNEVFLLDRDHKIIFIGSPFSNSVLEKYYSALIFQ